MPYVCIILSSHVFHLQIAILPVFRMEFINPNNEYHAGTEVPLNLRMITYLQDDEDETMYNSCSDIPYEVILSDTENFEYVKRTSKFVL